MRTRAARRIRRLTMASRQLRANKSKARRPAGTSASPLMAAMITAGRAGGEKLAALGGRLTARGTPACRLCCPSCARRAPKHCKPRARAPPACACAHLHTWSGTPRGLPASAAGGTAPSPEGRAAAGCRGGRRREGGGFEFARDGQSGAADAGRACRAGGWAGPAPP